MYCGEWPRYTSEQMQCFELYKAILAFLESPEGEQYRFMSQLPKPLGARVLVEELVTSLSIRERGKRAVSPLNGQGILVITAEDDELKNQCTLGEVVALGTDPFLEENGLAVGKVLSFSRYAGQHRFIEGKRYRMLGFQEIEDVADERPSDARLLSEIEEGAL